MAEGFSERSQLRGLTGITADKWIQKYVANLPTTGKNSGQTTATTKYGNKHDFPLGKCALLFTDLKIQRPENPDNHGGNATCVVGKVSEVVEIEEACFSMLLGKSHTLIPYKDPTQNNTTIVPLFLCDATDANQEAVLSQFGAQWQACGHPYKLDSSKQDSIVLMYMYSIQSIVWEIATTTSKAIMESLLGKLLLVAASAKSFFIAFPEAYKIVQALEDAEDALDMLNRSLAFLFSDKSWNTETFVRIVEVSLKRYLRRVCRAMPASSFPNNGGVGVDMVAEPPIGIYCICLMVQPLRDLVLYKSSVKDCIYKIDTQMSGLAQIIQNNHPERGKIMNKNILCYLCPNFTVAQLSDLYDYCLIPSSIDVLAPIAKMGFVPEIDVPFRYDVMGRVNGHPTKVTSRVSLGEAGWRVTSSLASEWTPLVLKSYGTYHFTPTVVGTAKGGIGNTKGDTNTAVVRFTTGYDVLPKDRMGISSAGMLYSETKNSYGVKKWNYKNLHQAISLEDPFELIIREGGIVLHQGSWKEWHAFKMDLSDLDANPLMVGFKFLRFVLKYTPLDPPKQPQPQQPPLEDVTGTALIRQLAAVKV